MLKSKTCRFWITLHGMMRLGLATEGARRANGVSQSLTGTKRVYHKWQVELRVFRERAGVEHFCHQDCSIRQHCKGWATCLLKNRALLWRMIQMIISSWLFFMPTGMIWINVLPSILTEWLGQEKNKVLWWGNRGLVLMFHGLYTGSDFHCQWQGLLRIRAKPLRWSGCHVSRGKSTQRSCLQTIVRLERPDQRGSIYTRNPRLPAKYPQRTQRTDSCCRVEEAPMIDLCR